MAQALEVVTEQSPTLQSRFNELDKSRVYPVAFMARGLELVTSPHALAARGHAAVLHIRAVLPCVSSKS